MARGNKYICRVCGKTYNYCPSCGLLPVPYLEDNFCCEDHAKLFAILSKHGCGLASAEETLEAVKAFGELGTLRPEIKAHIDDISAKETPVEEKFFNKKKQ